MSTRRRRRNRITNLEQVTQNTVGWKFGWSMQETSGAVAYASARSGIDAAALDGSITSATVGQLGAGNIPYVYALDGVNDFVDIYSATLNAQFNRTKGALIAWARVSGAGVWTDGVIRYIVQLYSNAQNRMSITKATGNNKFLFSSERDNVVLARTVTTSTLDLVMLSQVWNEVAGTEDYYFNDTKLASNTIADTWQAVALDANQSNIGCNDNAVPSSVFDGDITQVDFFDEPIGQSQVSVIYQAGK